VDDVAAGLASLAVNFQDGIFQMSALRDHSYFEMASSVAARLGVPSGLVHRDSETSPLFDTVPSSGALQLAAPPGCADWPRGGDVMQSLVEEAIS
jgi:hypothetical protein